MRNFICLRAKTAGSRFVYFAEPEKPKTAERPSGIPSSKEITRAHLDKVITAVDKNIKEVKDFYKQEVAGVASKKMPENVKQQLVKLEALKGKLLQLRSTPNQARQVLVDIYAIFSRLEAQGKKEQAGGDPLSTLLMELEIEKPELKAVESKEVNTKRLAWKAVENITRAGVLTQPMLDALKSYRPGVRILRFDFRLNGNPVTLFVERGPNGFAATGGIRNEEKLAKNQAPTWKSAQFNYGHSFKAEDERTPAIRVRPMKQYQAMIERGQLPPEKAAV